MAPAPALADDPLHHRAGVPVRQPMQEPMREPTPSRPVNADTAPATPDEARPPPAGAPPALITLAPPETPASAPLDLRWRADQTWSHHGAGGSGAGQAGGLARQDGRSNTRRPPSPATTLEAALGGDAQRIVETDLGQGSRRLERGRDCVLVHASRSATLEPMDGATRPQPRLAESCR